MFSLLIGFGVAAISSATTLFICMSWILLERVARDKKCITLTSYGQFLRDIFLTKDSRLEERKEKHKLRNLKATQSYEIIEEGNWVTANKKKGALVRVPPEFYEQKYASPRQNLREPVTNSNEEHNFRNVGQQRYHEYKDSRPYESKEVHIQKTYKRSKTEQQIHSQGGDLKKRREPYNQSHRQLSTQKRNIYKNSERKPKINASGLTSKELVGKNKPSESFEILERTQVGTTDQNDSNRKLPHLKPSDCIVIHERPLTGSTDWNGNNKITRKPMRYGLIWFLLWFVISIPFLIITFIGFVLTDWCSQCAQCVQGSSSLQEMRPEDGCVLVTGASSGLGYEMALEYLRRGFSVLGVGYSGGKILEAMKKDHEAFDYVVADLSKEEGVQKVVDKARNVSILVNNAGVSYEGRFQDQLNKEWDKHGMMLSLNVRTYVRLTQEFLPDMIKKKTGRIFAMGSVIGYAIGPNNLMYHGTKAFVNNFFTGLWYDLQGTGVGVTLGAPGATQTGFADKAAQSIVWKLPGITRTARETARLMVEATLAGKKHEAGSHLWNYIRIMFKLAPEFFVANVHGLAWSDTIDIHSLQPDLDSRAVR